MARLFWKICAGAWRYGWRWRNYRLLARAIYAAWLVRRHLADTRQSPSLAAAIAAVVPMTLPPQPHWRGVTALEICQFAAFVVGWPATWGRCVQRSLIAYRLLNGYGMPTRICFGIHRQVPQQPGHAWVESCAAPRIAIGETSDPYEQFTPVFCAPPWDSGGP